ncbi:aldehyde dehydrogenase [Shewanella sp. NFH-SH190041]|uniref:coniferyl aldehyde dehydrogenase n=1 Tax=Shewanella sp. NFH-SH190041 TaxID=2950245 RepID=UPI0021C37DCE|nr:coniferyl aldehyde dehydrogenase [Shewanella sp. NFH-SH190041]BDM64413.1 aldehyde dehydrogenase [Shewanella sp. NFH-SH190041]
MSASVSPSLTEPSATSSVDANSALSALLHRQQQAHLAHMQISVNERRERLQQVIALLVEGHQSLAAAMEADFDGRSKGFSLMNDVLGSMASLKHVRDNLIHWVPEQSRTPFAPYDQLGADAKVIYQPKGVVGIMGTWNAPVFTLLSPLACVLGAGNRAILKPSELAPRTAETLAELFARFVDPALVAVINGDARVGAQFAAQPFDHLVFTGSTAVGRKVMAAASANLTPVTLELGGKSPAIIGSQGDLDEYCRRLVLAKATNGGQLCISPDILYVPEDNLATVIDSLCHYFRQYYPTVTGNTDYVPIINQHHYERICGLVDDAKKRGVTVISSHDVLAIPDRRLPLQLVICPDDDAAIMQEEIFGPVLIIRTYQQIDAVIADINRRSNPLALYYLGTDVAEQQQVLNQTRSGGVTINDALMHAAMHDAPFGGTGASGMGHYHGREGFLQFSHAKTVFTVPAHDPRAEWGMLPPFYDGFDAMMASQVVPD